MKPSQYLRVAPLSDLNGTKRVCEEGSGSSDYMSKKTRVSKNLDDHEELILKPDSLRNVSIIKEENGVDHVEEGNQIGHHHAATIAGDGDGDDNIEHDDDDDNGNGNGGDGNGIGNGNGDGDDDDGGYGYGNGDGDDDGYGNGNGDGDDDNGNGNGDDDNGNGDNDGNGEGNGDGDGDNGNGDGDDGDGDGDGNGDGGDGYGNGDGDGGNGNYGIIKTWVPMKVNPQDIIIPEDQEREKKFRREELRDIIHFGYFDALGIHISGYIYCKYAEFSGELKAIIDRNNKRKAENLINLSPQFLNIHPRCRPAPSLLDLCLDALAKNADLISSLGHVPEGLKKRLIYLISDTGRMNMHILELLLKGSPTDIRIKNCSWFTQKEIVDNLLQPDLQNLRVLELNYTGHCNFKDIIAALFARYPNGLGCLVIFSLKAPGYLSERDLERLLLLAPSLQSINISLSTSLTNVAIEIIANSLETRLKELYIDYCSRIDVLDCVSSMFRFEHLEVLSVAGVETVDDRFVTLITATLGKSLRELNLAHCGLLTDSCLQAIGRFCPLLRSLNVSYLDNLTDLGLCYLADGCKSLERFNIAHTRFSDAVVAAFLESSGRSLKDLSLKHVGEVSFKTSFSLAIYSRKLIRLDLSWCDKLNDAALGFIIDNCSALKLLKVTGCTKITSTFLRRHEHSHVFIVGRGLVPLPVRVHISELEDLLLHHSSLETPE